MRITRSFAYAAALGATLACTAGHGDDPKPAKKPSIMENKLAAAQKVLG